MSQSSFASPRMPSPMSHTTPTHQPRPPHLASMTTPASTFGISPASGARDTAASPRQVAITGKLAQLTGVAEDAKARKAIQRVQPQRIDAQGQDLAALDRDMTQRVATCQNKMAKGQTALVYLKENAAFESGEYEEMITGRLALLDEQFEMLQNRRRAAAADFEAGLDRLHSRQDTLLGTSKAFGEDIETLDTIEIARIKKDAQVVQDHQTKRELKRLGAQGFQGAAGLIPAQRPDKAAKPKPRAAPAPGATEPPAQMKLSHKWCAIDAELQQQKAIRATANLKLNEQISNIVSQNQSEISTLRKERETLFAREVEPLWKDLVGLREAMAAERKARDENLAGTMSQVQEFIVDFHKDEGGVQARVQGAQTKRLDQINDQIWSLEKKVICNQDDRLSSLARFEHDLETAVQDRRETEQHLMANLYMLQSKYQTGMQLE
mmetsp:Transcript_147365/g.257569  ORF Transcript_147365/g.257569 Transcript_147365/m.257569 type:complete len:437 (-) Transcript_147365:1980-3290(-)